MPGTLQEFLVGATQKAADAVEKALLRLPDDKRDWKPMGDARTAVDMVAECAILNGITVDMIKTRAYPADFDFAAFKTNKYELSQDATTLKARLIESTTAVIAEIRAAPDADLAIVVPMPWGPATLAEILAYPYWNMSYHEGQINYIASMLGCLN